VSASHLYRDTAVVLRTYKLGEADRIVVLLTAEHGKVRAVAKGVRKTMSRFGARLEPMSHVRLLLYRGRELDIVSQAESVEPLSPMLASLDRASLGMAVLEAADQLALEREPNEQLYRMVIGALRTIADRTSPLVVPAFYWKLLAAEGLRPELDVCVRCGSDGDDAGFVAFDFDEGGVLCRNCRSGVAISGGALALLRAILGGRLNDALATPKSPATHEVTTLATKALEHHLERRLRAVAMFER
jgi:DNA repair protein RecO (recombination protein O)